VKSEKQNGDMYEFKMATLECGRVALIQKMTSQKTGDFWTQKDFIKIFFLLIICTLLSYTAW
jgi:hypothetical protein